MWWIIFGFIVLSVLDGTYWYAFAKDPKRGEVTKRLQMETRAIYSFRASYRVRSHASFLIPNWLFLLTSSADVEI